MNMLHIMARCLLVICTGTMGVLLVLGSVSGHDWLGMLGGLAVGQDTPLWPGLFLVALTVLFVLTGFQRRNKVRFLSFEKEGGRVSISTDAIADYIGKVEREFPSIIEMKTQVIPKRSNIDVGITVRIRAGPQIHEICEVLQQRVKEVLSSGLGIAQMNRVEVNVVEISSEHKAE